MTATQTLAERLDHDLKAAMRARDSERLAIIRALKTKVQEAHMAAPGEAGINDALHQKVAAAQVKALQKAMVELPENSARGQALRRAYSAEIAYLQDFLPPQMSAQDVRLKVRQAIDEHQLQGAAQAGRLTGIIMKAHRGEVDVTMLQAIVAEELR